MKVGSIPFATGFVVTSATLVGVHYLSKGLSKPLYALSMCGGLAVGYVLSDIISRTVSK